MRNGVVAFAPLDELNRDAVAYETQDECDGHPQQSGVYHYHDVPSCIVDASEGASTVVGFAYDGYPIVVERNAAGELPTNADLDECHGRTSPIMLDGDVVDDVPLLGDSTSSPTSSVASTAPCRAVMTSAHMNPTPISRRAFMITAGIATLAACQATSTDSDTTAATGGDTTTPPDADDSGERRHGRRRDSRATRQSARAQHRRGSTPLWIPPSLDGTDVRPDARSVERAVARRPDGLDHRLQRRVDLGADAA